MMKNNASLNEDFKIIEEIVGKVKEYKPFSDNDYSIGLEEGGEIFVVINKYSDFTIFKFLVNSKFTGSQNEKFLFNKLKMISYKL